MTTGLVQERKVHSTGTIVQVIDARQHPDFVEEEGGRWVTWCDEHETFCQHDTRALAIGHAAYPVGWCDECDKESYNV